VCPDRACPTRRTQHRSRLLRAGALLIDLDHILFRIVN
jgi:hypothetical protein